MMKFRKYRKMSLTQARLLTQEDERNRNGIIHTLEGKNAFQAGDYLARDGKGEWPIKKEDMEMYYQRVSEPDRNGFASYQPLDIREACQMNEAFTVGVLTGRAGDYLVRSQNMQWPVDQEIFERACIPVDD